MYQANHAESKYGQFSENSFLSCSYFPKYCIKAYFFDLLPCSLQVMEKYSLISWVVGSGPEIAVV